jgi:hypothetical protein
MNDPFEILKPCDVAWDEMEEMGGDFRHCTRCDERVYDIASMSPTEAARVAADRSNCLRVTRTENNRVLTAGRVAVLAASLVLTPSLATAAPRSPLVNPQPTERQLDRARAQAAKNIVVLRLAPTDSFCDIVPEKPSQTIQWSKIGRRS